MTGEETGYANVFVKVGPFDRIAIAQECPLLSFFAAGVKESWVPFQRNCKSSPVREVDNQFFAADRDPNCGGVLLRRQNTHAKPLPVSPHIASLNVRCGLVHVD